MRLQGTRKPGRHLLFGFALVLVVMGTVTTVSLSRITKLNRQMTELIERTNMKSELIFEMRDAMRQRQLRLRDMFLSKDQFEREELSQEHIFAASRFMVARLKLVDLGLSQAEDAALSRLTEGATVGAAKQREILDAILPDGNITQVASHFPALIAAQNRAFTGMSELVEIQREGAREQLAIVRKKFRNTIWVAVVLTGIGLFAGVAISVFVLRREAVLAGKLADYQGALEDKVRDRTQELEAFSHSLAHDLQTPLRAVTGFSQILQENTRDVLGKEDRDTLQRIASAGKFMAALLDNILTLMNISRTSPVLRLVDVSGLVRTASTHIRQRYPDVTASITIAKGITAVADKNMLLLAVECLFDNAFKAVRNEADPAIRFGVSMQDNQMVYYIQDNGIGFDPRYTDKLFGQFQRLHAQQEFDGTGVGLATVQRVLRHHGGKIWAEAVKGEGSVFYFTLGDLEVG